MSQFFTRAVCLTIACLSVSCLPSFGAEKAKAKKKADGSGTVVGENRATPVERIHVAKGFAVELLYSVPSEQQGSWINLCLDGRGRILASDQYGGLYRFAPPAPGKSLDPAAIERVPADVAGANGMVWAFDSLYIAVNDYEGKFQSGLYRVTDTNGDDQLDHVELLRSIDTRGDHGVHAVVPTPDGKALYVVTGNITKPIDCQRSLVPRCWGEDLLLPRLPDGRGFTRGVLAPAGVIYRASPDGKEFEIVCSGLRNCFDAAVNRDGELFTFDADEESDFNTSWYRPTRLCHVTSGAEFGWRSAGGKWPSFYPDSLPPVVDVGPGSPTGMTFGYGARFPAKYQQAVYLLDWSWGKLYAVHLAPSGASYTAIKEDFLSGAPLPLTDVLIHPGDGAMYFVIGGRKVQSGLYRVTYTGAESTAKVEEPANYAPERSLRQRLEAFHGRHDWRAIAVAWPHLAHADRFVRWAARTAVEHQPREQWAERALEEPEPTKQVAALLALARVAGIDPEHRKSDDPPIDTALGARLLEALVQVDRSALDEEQCLTWLRTIEITLHRFGPPEEAIRQALLAKLDPLFPAATREQNWMLCETLVYLQSPTVAGKAMVLVDRAAAQEEQIEYARSLRMLKTGWTVETHTAYFRWLLKAASTFRGGASFDKFIEFIRSDAVANLNETDRAALADVLAERPLRVSPLDGLAALLAGRPRTEWTLDELTRAAQQGMTGRNFENGRKMFGATACYTCHRFSNEGGMTGPDLSSAGRRYAPRDLLDQILNPSKEINEQYVPMVIVTSDDEVFRGVVVNLSGDTVTINTDPTDPNQRVKIDRKEIATVEPSKVSPMPTGLLSPLTSDEVLDLLAYILSGGDARHAMFRK